MFFKTPVQMNPSSMSPDRQSLLYFTGETSFDIGVLPMQEHATPHLIVATTFDERDGQFSPDGKWISSELNESGHVEVYVHRFWVPEARSRSVKRWDHGALAQ